MSRSASLRGVSATRPSVRDSLSKTVTRARTRGVVEVATALRTQARQSLWSTNELKLLVRDAPGPLQERPDVRFREATALDARLYADQIGTDSERTFLARLSDSTRCYVVEAEGGLLHASWVTTLRAWTSEIQAFMAPPPGDAYVYESFTRSDTRGRGIYPFALNGICAALAAQGAGRAWVGVEATNEPSVRAIGKAGFAEGFTLRFRRRLGVVQIRGVTGPLEEEGRGFLSRMAHR